MGYNWNKVDRMSAEAAETYLRKEFLKDKARKLNAHKEDKLTESILYRSRIRYEDGGEYWREYGFILPEDILFDYDPEEGEWGAYTSLTDEEIREWVMDNMWVSIYSDYDCTGREFTTSITWHRNPSGLISYIHSMALDI